MSDISIGLHFIVTGMVVVFLTLSILSAAMWFVGRFAVRVKEKKVVSFAIEPTENIGLDENELAAVSIALLQYRSEKEEAVLEFEPHVHWKVQGRIESLERNP
jgi:sodium pump decarboxylase gamma subunit